MRAERRRQCCDATRPHANLAQVADSHFGNYPALEWSFS